MLDNYRIFLFAHETAKIALFWITVESNNRTRILDKLAISVSVLFVRLSFCLYVNKMKTCDGMFPNILMPGVTVKSHAYFTGMDATNCVDQPPNVMRNQTPIINKTEMLNSSTQQSQKGFYTWLSSPRAIYNHRKMNNVAVISPTPHQT